MKYATFDSNGVLNGRYDSYIHTSIPAGAVQLSDADFVKTINETDGVWKLLNGAVVKTAFPSNAPSVPTVISMRQARLALLQSGYLTQVESLITAMPGADGAAARITWGYSAEVKRNHPLVIAISAQLPLTSQQLDDLFTLGGSL